MIKNHCIGCSAYIRSVSVLGETNYCSFRSDNSNGTCPCTECIVKVMCNDTCQNFYIWKDYITAKEAKG